MQEIPATVCTTASTDSIGFPHRLRPTKSWSTHRGRAGISPKFDYLYIPTFELKSVHSLGILQTTLLTADQHQ